MKNQNVWLLAGVLCLGMFAGMKFSDFMDNKIVDTLRETIALQKTIVVAKDETIDIKNQTIGYCVTNVSMCVDLLDRCERSSVRWDVP